MTLYGILDALKTLYDGSGGAALRALTPGGFWTTCAPDGVTQPLLVCTCPSSYSESCMDGTSVDYVLIQISGYTQMMVGTDSGYAHLVKVSDKIVKLYGNITTGYTGGSATSLKVSATLPRHDAENDGYAVDTTMRIVLH